MSKSISKKIQPLGEISSILPSLKIKKLGVVSRDYVRRFGNGQRDFSYSMLEVLTFLDNNCCDAVLFSLYSVVVTDAFSVLDIFSTAALSSIKVVLLEEFIDSEPREAGRFVVYYLVGREWKEYEFKQSFGTTIGLPRERINVFVNQEMPNRILGNTCVLLCGETNIVKYAKKIDQQIHDDYGVLDQIPSAVKVILNPIHDRMTGFEMKLKRAFLSRNNRIVISVWNKGRIGKNGKTRDGEKPAWTVYKDGKLIDISPIPNNFDLEIGIVDC